MKSATTFTGAIDIQIIIHNFLPISSKTGEYFFSFSHANFALECASRLRASNPITLPDDCGNHDAFLLCCVLHCCCCIPYISS